MPRDHTYYYSGVKVSGGCERSSSTRGVKKAPISALVQTPSSTVTIRGSAASKVAVLNSVHSSSAKVICQTPCVSMSRKERSSPTGCTLSVASAATHANRKRHETKLTGVFHALYQASIPLSFLGDGWGPRVVECVAIPPHHCTWADRRT